MYTAPAMYKLVSIFLVALSFSLSTYADDGEKMVRKAVEHSTLNQPGTKPFHLKAELAPSRESDRGTNRTGTVVIWWASPTQWKREVRSAEFHQVEIVNGASDWQKNEGDYFPEWLREVAVALINPVPQLDQVLQQVKDADVKKMMGSTYYSWITQNKVGDIQGGIGASVALTDSTGLLFYGGDVGWGAIFHDYQNFHGRMVARKVGGGTPEVTAQVTTLEDLKDNPSTLFEPPKEDSSSPLLRTLVVPQTALGKNVSPDPPAWPTLKDGPLEGTITTEVTVDRTGKVRQVGTVLANNPGVTDIARDWFASMQFKPYLDNGQPVQVMCLFTIPYKSTRPTGFENFDTAHNYFEHGRQVSFPATGKVPYVLHAKFKAKTSSGNVEEGDYADTWTTEDTWRREATIGSSKYVRSQEGQKRYQLAEGPDAKLLRLVLRVLEPIPAIDTFVESDWRIKRDIVNNVNTIRVLTGYEKPSGEFDDENVRAFWFDDSGRLVKTYFWGMATERSQFEDFNGMQIAHEIKVLRSGGVAMLIHVTDVSRAENISSNTFKVAKHEWTRAFTDEVR